MGTLFHVFVERSSVHAGGGRGVFSSSSGRAATSLHALRRFDRARASRPRRRLKKLSPLPPYGRSTDAPYTRARPADTSSSARSFLPIRTTAK